MINLSASTPDQAEVLTRGKQYEATNTLTAVILSEPERRWAKAKRTEDESEDPENVRRVSAALRRSHQTSSWKLPGVYGRPKLCRGPSTPRCRWLR